MEKTSSTRSAGFQRHEEATLPAIAEPESVWELNWGAGVMWVSRLGGKSKHLVKIVSMYAMSEREGFCYSKSEW